jgi:hypothetical protein
MPAVRDMVHSETGSLDEHLELLTEIDRGDLVIRLLELSAQCAEGDLSLDEYAAARDELMQSA